MRSWRVLPILCTWWFARVCRGLHQALPPYTITVPDPPRLHTPSHLSHFSLLLALEEPANKFREDVVVRVVDANTIKLEKTGLLSFSYARTPTKLSDCAKYAPSRKLDQLLPPRTKVRVLVETEGRIPRGLVYRRADDVFVNARLVETGFAAPRGAGALSERFEELYAEAKKEGRGLYAPCPAEVVEQRVIERAPPPKNPGDVVGCSDFEVYEDALRWFEKYEPYYGDVARLDRNNDGVPCSGLPHTLNQNRYRMKIPRTNP